jgi:hypothetical protein
MAGFTEMLIVPVQALPNQTLQVQLDGQATTLNIYQYAYGLFTDVLLNGEVVITGVICENRNRIVRSLYLGYSGDFIWVDTQGSDDPIFSGLGSRWLLIYLAPGDLPPGQG